MTSPPHHSVARTIRCPSCGGAAPIVVLAPAIACPFCRHTIVIPPQLLQELTSYGYRVVAAQQQATADQAYAAQWTMWTRPGTSPARHTLIAVGLIFGPMVVVLVPCLLLAKARLIPEVVVSVATMISSFLGLAAYIAWYIVGMSRQRAQSGAAHGAVIACPQCGASNAIAPGRAVERCRYCGAGLVASGTVIRDVVADAERMARRAKLERYRAERSGMAYYAGYSANNYVAFVAPGMYLVMFGFAAVAVTFDMAFGKEPFNPAVLIMWGVFLLGAAGIFAFFRYRSDKKQAWRDALDSLTRPLQGCSLDDLNAAVSWLNAYWAGPIEAIALFPGPYFRAATGVAEGYPFLIWADPVAASEDHHAALRLHFAAWFAGGAGQAPGESIAVTQHRTALLHLGFSCTADEAGLTLVARDDIRKGLHRAPDGALLARVIWQTARMAQAWGARPATALPD